MYTDSYTYMPALETPRLRLRKLTMRDASDMYRYCQDREVARHVLWEAHTSILETRAYIRYNLYQYRSGEPGSWGIVLRETGRVVGTIGYMSYNADNSTVEIGYSLAREQWSKGLMTEALRAVIDETFRTLKVHRIEAMHFTDNPASGRVMEKCGMTQEALLKSHTWHDGQWKDCAVYRLLKEEFQ